MNAELQGQIQKFLYHISNEDYANADKQIKSVIEKKVMDSYKEEYEKLQNKKKVQESNEINNSGVHPDTPIEVIDGHTKQVLRNSTHKNVKRARNWAEKKNQEYGAHRYYVNVKHHTPVKENIDLLKSSILLQRHGKKFYVMETNDPKFPGGQYVLLKDLKSHGYKFDKHFPTHPNSPEQYVFSKSLQ